MKKKLITILSLIALMSILFGVIGSAGAYFTTYTEAKGTRLVKFGGDSHIEEKVEAFVKKVVITNDADSHETVYVRASAFCGDDYSLVYSGDGWEKKDDYWYYSTPLAPGESTEELVISIYDAKTGKIPVAEDGKEFNVVVIYETTPATVSGSDSDGKPVYEPADWSKKAEAKTEEVG